MGRSLKILAVTLAATVTMLSFECSRVTAPGDDQDGLPLTSVGKKVATASSSFALNLFGRVASQEHGKNFFISPFSVSMALAMTLNGAHGQTYTDMQKTLGLEGLSNDDINQSYEKLISLFGSLDPNVKFNIANSIWYRNTFHVIESFLNVNSTYYGAEVTPLDFADPNAVSVMNSWVNDKTSGRIPSIIDPPIDSSVVMFLMNALYFNGTWKYSFDVASTRPKPFYVSDGSMKTVATMVVHDTLRYYSGNDFEVVELPYGKGDYSMLIILPGGSLSLDDFAASFDKGMFDDIVNGLSDKDIQLALPKFKVEYRTDMVDVLTQLGMGIAFSPSADFTRISSEGGLSISKVLHKTYVDVNEEGTEAAAVTVVEIFKSSIGGGGPLMINIDRPFLFLIKENHENTVMFIGAVADPTVLTQ